MPGYAFPSAAAGGALTPGVMAVGKKILFVAKEWPDGADPKTFFTSVAAALVQAATLSPTAAEPVVIIVGPGDYTEALTLVSNVNIASWSASPNAVSLSGAITWTPGVGINAPQTSVLERISLQGLTLGPISVDATGKTSDFSELVLLRCIYFSSLSITGRPGGGDSFFAQDTVTISGVTDFMDLDSAVWEGGVVGTLGLHGFTTAIFDSVIGAGPALAEDTSVMIATCCEWFLAVTVDDSATWLGTNCLYASTITNLSVTALAVVTSSSILGGGAAIIGPGPIDRDQVLNMAVVLAAGPNVIPIVPPFSAATYNVNLTSVGPPAPPASAPVVALKAPGAFTVTVPAPITMDITVTRE